MPRPIRRSNLSNLRYEVERIVSRERRSLHGETKRWQRHVAIGLAHVDSHELAAGPTTGPMNFYLSLLSVFPTVGSVSYFIRYLPDHPLSLQTQHQEAKSFKTRRKGLEENHRQRQQRLREKAAKKNRQHLPLEGIMPTITTTTSTTRTKLLMTIIRETATIMNIPKLLTIY